MLSDRSVLVFAVAECIVVMLAAPYRATHVHIFCAGCAHDVAACLCGREYKSATGGAQIFNVRKCRLDHVYLDS